MLAECFGKTVAGIEDGSCAERHMGLQATEYKVAFHDGDYKVAVQWYERLVEGGSSERREFKMGKPQIDVINSTELRAHWEPARGTGGPVRDAPIRGGP